MGKFSKIITDLLGDNLMKIGDEVSIACDTRIRWPWARDSERTTQWSALCVTCCFLWFLRMCAGGGTVCAMRLFDYVHKRCSPCGVGNPIGSRLANRPAKRPILFRMCWNKTLQVAGSLASTNGFGFHGECHVTMNQLWVTKHCLAGKPFAQPRWLFSMKRDSRGRVSANWVRQRNAEPGCISALDWATSRLLHHDARVEWWAGFYNIRMQNIIYILFDFRDNCCQIPLGCTIG